MTTEMYSAEEIDQKFAQFSVQPMAQISEFIRFQTHKTQLYRALTMMRELSVEIAVTTPVTVETLGQIEFEHRGSETLMTGPVGISTKIGWRRADVGQQLPPMPTTRAPTASYPAPINWVKGGKSGCNIRDLEDHYCRTLLCSPPFTLDQPGLYRIEVWATAHSALSPTSDGLATVNVPAWAGGAEQDPYNHFIVRVKPA